MLFSIYNLNVSSFTVAHVTYTMFLDLQNGTGCMGKLLGNQGVPCGITHIVSDSLSPNCPTSKIYRYIIGWVYHA